MAPHDREFRETIVDTLGRLESFFLGCTERARPMDDHLIPAGGRLGTSSARRADGRARAGARPPERLFSKA